MAEVREVHVDRHVDHRPRGGGSGLLPIGMFLLGAIVLAVVVLMLLDVHWTISWPAGHVDIGLRPPVATAATQAPSNTN